MIGVAHCRQVRFLRANIGVSGRRLSTHEARSFNLSLISSRSPRWSSADHMNLTTVDDLGHRTNCRSTFPVCKETER